MSLHHSYYCLRHIQILFNTKLSNFGIPIAATHVYNNHLYLLITSNTAGSEVPTVLLAVTIIVTLVIVVV